MVRSDRDTQLTRIQVFAAFLQRISAAKWFVAVETATVILVLFVLSRADVGIMDLVGISGLERRWTLLGAFVAILAFPVIRGMQATIVRLVASDVLLLGICGLAALSILWSPLPTATFPEVVALGLTIVVAAYLAARFDARTLAVLLFTAMVMAAALSMLATFTQPELGRHEGGPHLGIPRGLYEHKNVLGLTMGIGAVPGTLLVLDGLIHRRRWTIPATVGLALIIAALWMSDSRMAQVSYAFSLMVTLGFSLLRRGPDRLAEIAGGALGVIPPGLTGLLVSGVIMPMSTLFGRGHTMFARLEIWSAVFDVLGKRYWLGLGFESFWVDGAPTRQTVETTVGWEVPTAHNGYIEIILGIGLIGLLLFSAHLVRTCIASARLAQRTRRLATLGPIMILALIVAINLAESHLLEPGSLLLATYLVCSFWTSPKHGRYGRPQEGL